MKNKKIIIIVFIVLALLLIGGGTIYSLYIKEPKRQEEPKKTPQKNDSVEEKITELKSIITPDKKIRLGSTRVYECNGTTGMMLNIIPLENFEKVYLKITMKLAKSKEEIAISLDNLKINEQREYEYQTLNDWSTLKSWSVEIIDEKEAKKIMKN